MTRSKGMFFLMDLSEKQCQKLMVSQELMECGPELFLLVVQSNKHALLVTFGKQNISRIISKKLKKCQESRT